MGITVVLLAYKEAENLDVLIPRIISNVQKTGEPYEILVVDTAEPLDDTQKVCEKYGARYVNQEYPGFGGAYRTAIKYAEMTKFMILDSDGQHNPDDIPRINRMFDRGHFDVVIGSRYVRGGENNENFVSRLMSFILNTSFRVCLGLKARDLSTNFRMYDTKQLKRLKLKAENLDVLQEILFKMKLKNPDFRVGEVPITLEHRMYGESKRQLMKFIIDFAKSLVNLTGMRVRYAAYKRKHG